MLFIWDIKIHILVILVGRVLTNRPSTAEKCLRNYVFRKYNFWWTTTKWQIFSPTSLHVSYMTREFGEYENLMCIVLLSPLFSKEYVHVQCFNLWDMWYIMHEPNYFRNFILSVHEITSSLLSQYMPCHSHVLT